MNPLPEKAKSGLTWRRLRNALRAPSLLWRNARFWWNSEVSSSEHIFVVGPPRSGTTLVKNVLRAHTEVCGVDGETCVLPAHELRRRTSAGDLRGYGGGLVQASRSVTGLFDRYADTIKKQVGAPYFLEKTPEQALRLDYIAEHFPAAHTVFVLRDPRDGLRSAQNFPGYWATLPDEDRTGEYLATWHRSVRAYLDHADRDAVISVRYEDFCREPEDSLQGLTKSIGIEKQDYQLAQRRTKKDTRRRWRLMPGSRSRSRPRVWGSGGRI
jgi:hypothetical protein